MRVTLCDNCRDQINPDKPHWVFDLNLYQYASDGDVDKLTFQPYDFCSKKCMVEFLDIQRLLAIHEIKPKE